MKRQVKTRAMENANLVYVFKTRYRCPVCGTFKTKRYSQTKDIQYRKCEVCKDVTFREFAEIHHSIPNKLDNDN